MSAISPNAAALPQAPFLPITEPLWAVSFYASAMLSVTMWDVILTLPAEVRRHRLRGFTPATVPFVLCRLLGLLTLIFFVIAIRKHWSTEACSKFGFMIPTIANLVTLCSSAIFAMRTVAIWQGDRRVTLFVSLLWAAHVATSLYATASSIIAAPGPGGLSCVPLMNPKHAYYYWYYIVNVIADTTYVGLSTWRLIIHVRHNITTRLSRHLIADGLLYFVAVDAIHILNACFFAAPTDWPFTFINASAAVAVTTIATSRLVLFTSATTGTPNGAAGGAGGANPAYPLVKQLVKAPRRFFATGTATDSKHDVSKLRDAENGSAREVSSFSASPNPSSKGGMGATPSASPAFPVGFPSSGESDCSASVGSKQGMTHPFEVFNISAHRSADQGAQQPATVTATTTQPSRSRPSRSGSQNELRSPSTASGIQMWTETVVRREEDDTAAPRFFHPR